MNIEDLLLRHRIADAEQLALARSRADGRRLDRVVVEMGLADEQTVLSALADEFGMTCVDLRDADVDRALLAEFPTATIFRHTLLPLKRENGKVTVATSDPLDLTGIDELRAVSGKQLDVVLARHDDIARLIKENLGVGGDTINQLVAQQGDADAETWADDLDTNELAELAQAASVVRLVNELLTEALQQHASDIHIEPQEHGLLIRYRIDGVLWVQAVPDEIHQFFAAIVTRLKIMSRLNIAEKRLPQDGRMKLRLSGREIDVRVSIIPMLYGEGVVLRLLDKTRMTFDLAHVGMPADTADQFRKLATKPHGIILVTGPTGHGKTTTLYSTLNEIRSTRTKIVTVEDPVEYHINGISQIQVNAKIGLTFAAGLRSILRHDPDVILVGEIRDRETAEIAIQAALTGHLVFSTLHSNDAPSAFTRLIDMGIEPYLVASTITGVMAQRLVRKLCPACKQPHMPEDLPPDLVLPSGGHVYQAGGCHPCRNTGYSGRTGVFELLPTDAEVQRLCVQRATTGQIRRHAAAHGFASLRECGWRKVAAGETSVDEVLRISDDATAE